MAISKGTLLGLNIISSPHMAELEEFPHLRLLPNYFLFWKGIMK